MSVNEADIVLDQLATRLTEEKFCDVSFKIGHETIKANRVMLAIRSPVFEKKLYDGGDWSKKDHVVKLDAEKTMPAAFLAFLEFIYAGELEMNEENVIYLLWLAREFGFPSLASACVTWCMRNVNVSNALDLYLLALKFEENEVAAKCLHVIRRDPNAALAVAGFTEVNADILASFTADPLMDIDEIDLFRLVQRWNEANSSVAADKLTRVVESIRYGAISPKDLVNTVKQSKLAPIELYVEALEFHADPRRVDASLDRFQPRQGPGKVPDYSGSLGPVIPASALENVGPHGDDGDDDSEGLDNGPAAGYPGDDSGAASKLPSSHSTKKSKKDKAAGHGSAPSEEPAKKAPKGDKAGKKTKDAKDKDSAKKGASKPTADAKKPASVKQSAGGKAAAADAKADKKGAAKAAKKTADGATAADAGGDGAGSKKGKAAEPADDNNDSGPLSPGKNSEKKKKSWFGL